MFQHLLDQAEGATGVDPDMILDTVALCHDSHQAVLDKQQEHLRVAVSTWREEHFRCLRDDEFDRSRSRVLEVEEGLGLSAPLAPVLVTASAPTPVLLAAPSPGS